MDLWSSMASPGKVGLQLGGRGCFAGANRATNPEDVREIVVVHPRRFQRVRSAGRLMADYIVMA
jgi:hypothetical protein